MKLTTNLIFLITFIGILSGELDVDVRISDLQRNALNLSQIEDTALMVVEFRRNGEELYTFNLRQERRVYSPNFSVYKQDEKGNLVRIPDEKINKKCFFSGYVRGFTDSMVAMSFCRGITGIFNAAPEKYEVNRVETNTVPSFTKAKLKLLEASNATYKCGVNTSHPAQARRRRRKRRVIQMDKEFKVIEVKMVVSKNLYDRLGSEEEVNKYITVLIMQANWFFRNVSFTLVTKAVEIWTTVNEINITRAENNPSLIRKFVRNRLNTQKAKNLTYIADDYDCAVLNLDTESAALLGVAIRDEICSFPQNVALVSHSIENMHEIGVTLVHEIAHLLGLPHEDECEGEGYYIMNANISSESDTKYVWSQCSIEQLDKEYDNDNYFCLGSEAKLDSVVCGDGIQDGEEECDVGMLPNASSYSSKCCNPETCKLVEGAKCYKGRCCNLQTCMFRASGAKCRSRNGNCDLKDVCNGTSSSCRNKYKRNGYPCRDRGFCFKGKCRTRNGICESRIDQLAKASLSICYENRIWSPDFRSVMNCGLDYSGFITCAPIDRRCGKMLCDTRDMNFEIPRWHTFRDPCAFLGELVHPSHKNSLSYVPDGTFCGNNMFCINRKCVNVTTYMRKEFETYHDANFSYDDQEVEFIPHSRVTSGVSLPKLQSLSCMLLLASLLAFFA